MDTIIRGERGKTNIKQEKRRSSIEVGCLPNGQLGSMMAEVSGVGLSKKQRKRKKRKDSRLGLRNVVEELESDDSKAGILCMTPSMGQSRGGWWWTTGRGVGAGQSSNRKRGATTARPAWQTPATAWR